MKIFQKLTIVFIGLILISSLTLQSSFAATASFTPVETDPATNLSQRNGISKMQDLVASGGEAYLVWRDVNDIYFINSTNGVSFPVINPGTVPLDIGIQVVLIQLELQR